MRSNTSFLCPLVELCGLRNKDPAAEKILCRRCAQKNGGKSTPSGRPSHIDILQSVSEKGIYVSGSHKKVWGNQFSYISNLFL